MISFSSFCIALLDLEENSMSHNLLDRCMEAALGRGTDLSSEYSPYLPVDLLQTLLVDIHEYAGCSWFTAIDSQLTKLNFPSLNIFHAFGFQHYST
jgi:hypothetical protein